MSYPISQNLAGEGRGSASHGGVFWACRRDIDFYRNNKKPVRGPLFTHPDGRNAVWGRSGAPEDKRLLSKASEKENILVLEMYCCSVSSLTKVLPRRFTQTLRMLM